MSFKKPFKSVPVQVNKDYRHKLEELSARRARERRKETIKRVLAGLAIGLFVVFLIRY